MNRWTKFVVGVAVAGSLAASTVGAQAGIASADPPPWVPGHDHDGPGGPGGPPPPWDNNGPWNNNPYNNGPWNNGPYDNGPYNNNGPWGNPPPPPPWAPFAQVFWDPTRQAWGFYNGPVWFPA